LATKPKLGKIGTSLESISEEKTPLELQIANFVKKMAIAGAIVFVISMGNKFLAFSKFVE
jgi:P-type Ca2+ transporter type 2C